MTKFGIVLGGGGITGIAWEVGIVKALIASGVDLFKADKILGTSAGSFVGAALANQVDMDDYLAQLTDEERPKEQPKVDKEVYQLWARAFTLGGEDPVQVGKYFGEIIQSNPSHVSVDERMRIVEGRLITHNWPNQLVISAIEARTGILDVFTNQSGISLPLATAASGAVPGIWPAMELQGKTWIDGGMVSSMNALYFNDFENLLILAPLDQKYGSIRSVYEEAALLREHANVVVITPDEESRKAIGANIYDSTKSMLSATAGERQGNAVSGKVKELLKE